MTGKSSWKAGLAALSVAAMVALTGCLEQSQTFTIYPDGSGKVEMKVVIKGQMAAMVKAAQAAETGAGAAAADPAAELRQQFGGKTYWQDVKVGDGPEGSYGMSGTAYFDNVNELAPTDGSIQFVKDGDGFKFTVHQGGGLLGAGNAAGMGGAMTPEQQQAMAAQIPQMKAMFEGLEVNLRVRMPGQVAATDGFNGKEGRMATFRLDTDGLIAMAQSGARPADTFVASAGAPGRELQAEWDAFKQELAKVKAAAASQAGK